MAVTLLLCVVVPPHVHPVHTRFVGDLPSLRDQLRMNILLAGVFVSALLSLPSLEPSYRKLLSVWQPLWTAALAALLCLGMAAFIVHYGRIQYGAFDHNIVVETGWRQFLGQRPYTDFYTAAPPLFNIGLGDAFRLLGPRWDSMLALTAAFACGTFLWILVLLRQLRLNPVLALGTAFAVEAATMLAVCWWWYNNVTLTLATIFFLTTIALLLGNRSVWMQLSFVASVTLLGLAKPNIAALVLTSCIFLLLIVSRDRLRIALLAVAGAALACAWLVLQRVSIGAMLQTYRGVGRTHGILTHFGYRQMPKASQHVALLWLFLFSLPMLLVVPRLVQSLRERAWKRSALFLMLLIAPLIAAFGIANNADCLDLECVLLYVANMLVLFVLGPRPPMLVRRLAIALLCAAVVQDVYTGQERLRVSWVGVHTFFEWDQPLVTVASGPFEHMRISQTLVAVNAQTLRAVRSNPGPYFFGPRLDMQYMNMGLPSPVGLAAWWHPGTAFDVTEMPTLLHNWQQHRFNTLVFLKGDYAYYPAQFCRMIADGYTPDDRYPGLTVYHADSSPSPAQQAGVMRACVPQP